MEILAIFLLLGFIFTGMKYLNNKIDSRMYGFKRNIVARIEKLIGRKIKYGSISPSIFRYFEIRNLVVYSAKQIGQPVVMINKIKIYYSIYKLLRTNDPAASLIKINISNSKFFINTLRDREVVTILQELINPKQTGLNKDFVFIPRITGSNITITLIDENSEYTLSNLFFNIKNLENEIGLDIRGNMHVKIVTAGQGSLFLNSKIKLRGSVDNRLTWSELRVRFYAVKSNLFNLSKQTFQISLKNDQLNIQKIQDKNPFNVQLKYSLSDKNIELHLISENFKPGSMIKLLGRFAPYNRWLSSKITAEAVMNYGISNKKLSYVVDLKTNIKPGKAVPLIMLTSHFSGNSRELFFKPLIADSKLGTVEFTGSLLFENYLPSGLLNLINIRIPNGNDLDASFQLTRARQTMYLHSEKLIVGSTVFKRFNLNIKPEAGKFLFKLQAILNDALNNTTDAEGVLEIRPELLLKAQVAIKNLPPERFFSLIDSDAMSKQRIFEIMSGIKVTTSLDLKTDFKNIEVSSDSVVIRGRLKQKNFVNFAMSYKDKKLNIGALNGRIGNNTFSGKLSGEIESPGKMMFQVSSFFNGYFYSLNGRYVSGVGLIVKGNYGLNISLLHQTGGRLSLDIKCRNIPVPVYEKNIVLSAAIDGEYKNIKEWYIKSKDLTVRNIDFLKSRNNSVTVSLSIKPGTAKLFSVRFNDSVSNVTGEGSINFSMDKPYNASGWLFLQNKSTHESYRVKGDIVKNNFSADINFNSSPLERLGNFNITGAASGSLALTDILNGVKAKLSLMLENGRLNADPLSFSINTEYENDRIKFSSMRIGYLSHSIANGNGFLDLKKGRFMFLSDYRAKYFSATNVDLILKIDARLIKPVVSAGNSNFLKNLFNQSIEGNALFSSIKVNGKSYKSWDMKVQVKDKSLTFDGGPEDTIHGLIDDTGSFKLLSLKPFPIVMEADGIINKNKIDSNAVIKRLDITVLNLPLRNGAIVFKSGNAAGNIRISGPINDPDIYGNMDVLNGKANSQFTPVLIQPLNARLIFTGKGFTLEQMTTYVNKRPLVVKGNFKIDHWVPDAFDMEFNSPDPLGVKFAYNFGPIIVDGYVTGKIRVKGDLFGTTVNGSLTANYCKIALGEKKPEQKKEKSEEITPVKVNLTVKTGKRVEFYWPSLNFPILRAYTDIGNSVKIDYNESDGSYSVRGDVGIQGGEVFYFDRSFYLKGGQISFDENQEGFDPRVKMLAEIREQDEKGEEIKIYLEADNKLSKFSPRFYSDPPRPDVEILSMVGGSIFGKVQEQGIGISAVMLTSEIVSQFGILQPFERAVRDYLGLDLFSIRTQIIQNLILEKILGNVTNPLDNTTLSLGKYLGNDLFLEMLVRLKTMAMPSSNIYYLSGITSDIEVNLEWTTPFFLMEWSLIPKHPEDLFLSDNSLTLKWRYSY